MESIDQTILMFFATHRVEWLSFLMLVTTYAGGILISNLVALFSVISFAVHKHKKHIAPFLISICGTAATVFLLKIIFGKARPLAEALYLEQSFSFPSFHAAIAMSLYGFLIYTIWGHEKHHLQNKAIWSLSILILLIGLSRLYLGVHYFSDVLAGFAVGIIWLTIAIFLRKSKTI